MLMIKRMALALRLAIGGVGGAHADVVVGSKIDTEGTLLGNMILVTLQANGIKMDDRISLGGTPVVRKAIIGGEIDIYPEYTGTPRSSSTNAQQDAQPVPRQPARPMRGLMAEDPGCGHRYLVTTPLLLR